jgi:signal transduction histidine kinase
MNLTRFETQDGIELVINESGESFATVRGYARMSGRDASTISRRLKGVGSDRIKEAEILTPGGLQGVALISEDIITDWIVEDNPPLAKAMLKAGVRVFLHTAAGYQLTSSVIASVAPVIHALPQTYIEALELLLASEKEKEALVALENSMQAAQIEGLEEDIDRLSELADELFDYSSIIRIAKLNNVNEKVYNWRKLKAASKVKGVEVKHAPCQKFGVKNLYHIDAWKTAYPEAKLPEASGLTTV